MNFTHKMSFTVNSLTAAWNRRESELKEHEKALAMAQNSEVLFNYLYLTLRPYVATMTQRMHTVCQTAVEKSGLQIPIWEYKTRSFALPQEDERQELSEMSAYEYTIWRADRADTIYTDGLHWTVHSDVGRTCPIRVVVRDSDVLLRLAAALFPSRHFTITDRICGHKYMPYLKVYIETRELVLNFYPAGLPLGLRERMNAVVNRPRVDIAPTARVYTGTTDVPPKVASPLDDDDDSIYDDMPPLMPACYCCAD